MGFGRGEARLVRLWAYEQLSPTAKNKLKCKIIKPTQLTNETPTKIVEGPGVVRTECLRELLLAYLHGES